MGPKAASKQSLKLMRKDERSVLRERVLDVAAEIIARDGVDALSMRKLALALNCAPMSLYSYFKDKHELLLALAQRSFSTLAKRLARQKIREPVGALRALYMAYARFGLDNPSEYRTMFMTPEAQTDRSHKKAEEMYRENPAFALGVDSASSCIEAGVLAGDPHYVATLLWTNVHGAVSAILCLSAFPFGDPDQYIAKVIDLTLSALRIQNASLEEKANAEISIQ